MELRIASVEVLVVEGMVPARTGTWQRQVRPLDRYAPGRVAEPERPASPGERRPAQALYLRLVSSDGVEGLYGPVDEEAAWPIVRQLSGFLVGEDALAVNHLWDKLQRFDRHARHGHLKMAVSAIDNAVWDLRARRLGVPVWRLLGGGARTRIPAYASTLGLVHDPGELEQEARRLAEAGFGAQKWFFAHGPGDGSAGLEANVALVERLRAVLGPRYPLMFDAFMGWDVRYAQEWAGAVEHLRPSWLEEPLAAGAGTAYRALRRSVRVPLAAGEHLYDRDEILPLLNDGVLSVLQVDPEWCGGVTELVRMCQLAELFGVPVIPHGHGLHAALHVVASQSPEVCPMAEYLLTVMPGRFAFEREAPHPVDGFLALPEKPGFAIELDESKVSSIRSLSDR